MTGRPELFKIIPRLSWSLTERYNPRIMQIKDLGEFGVIALLNEMVVKERGGPDNGAAFDFRLLVGTGDDTAAWHTGQATELGTTDTMVEGVHFTRETTPWPDLGWKSMASNISDIAAMGGLPLYSLITLGLPPDTKVDDLKKLYQGLLEIGGKYGVGIVGGDLVRSPVVFITVVTYFEGARRANRTRKKNDRHNDTAAGTAARSATRRKPARFRSALRHQLGVGELLCQLRPAGGSPRTAAHCPACDDNSGLNWLRPVLRKGRPDNVEAS